MPLKPLYLTQALKRRIQGILKTKRNERVQDIIIASKRADKTHKQQLGKTRLNMVEITPPFPRTKQKKVFLVSLEAMDQSGITGSKKRQKIAQIMNRGLEEEWSARDLIYELSEGKKILTQKKHKNLLSLILDYCI